MLQLDAITWMHFGTDICCASTRMAAQVKHEAIRPVVASPCSATTRDIIMVREYLNSAKKAKDKGATVLDLLQLIGFCQKNARYDEVCKLCSCLLASSCPAWPEDRGVARASLLSGCTCLTVRQLPLSRTALQVRTAAKDKRWRLYEKQEREKVAQYGWAYHAYTSWCGHLSTEEEEDLCYLLIKVGLGVPGPG
jgi:hypothetical protein